MIRPTLFYDASCAFCRFWVARWKKLTGDRVVYQPLGEDKKTLKLTLPSGEIFFGAHAVCRLLAEVTGHGIFFWLYEHVPGYSTLAELAYRLVSSCRRCTIRVVGFFIVLVIALIFALLKR